MSIFEKTLPLIKETSSLVALEALRLEILGKKGQLGEAMRGLASLDPEERKARGEHFNAQKVSLLEAFAQQKEVLEKEALEKCLAEETLDLSLPLSPRTLRRGGHHPLTVATRDLLTIFEKMGFGVRQGPDIEDDFHNFTALNIPLFHPARATQDTFYLPEGPKGEIFLLRTHTSPVQIRTLVSEKAPLRIVVPGRVFRSDSDATHSPMFHQIEGLVIEEGIHMGHLKGCLEELLHFFFGRPVPLRFRPSFFPFTEPSAEVDILCERQGSQLKIGEGTEWLEVLGCGMVHPQVIANCGLDPHRHQGFAFGMGIERLTMLRAGVTDLRRFFENNLRWLAHYGVS